MYGKSIHSGVEPTSYFEAKVSFHKYDGQATIMQMFVLLIMHLKTMRVCCMFMDTLGRGKLIIAGVLKWSSVVSSL